MVAPEVLLAASVLATGAGLLLAATHLETEGGESEAEEGGLEGRAGALAGGTIIVLGILALVYGPATGTTLVLVALLV